MSSLNLTNKRIAAQAYEALAEALAVIHWNKQPFESYLRTSLRAHPEITAQLDFSQTKRIVAGAAVGLLQCDPIYDATTLALMTEIAEMTRFPNLERQTDAAVLTLAARAAIKVLADLTATYRCDLNHEEQARARREAEQRATDAARLHARDLSVVKVDFVALHGATDAHARGRHFENVLHRLFEIHDMEPRLSYSLDHEQIDGSINFDTDDYLIEAKWWKDAVDRNEADVFASKICRKGRNTLGMFISVNGFTDGFRTAHHASGTPFITADGDDLFHVLDGRVDLPDLLRRKRRHLNDTGSCWFPARTLVSGR